MYILPYKKYSKSAKALSKALNFKKLNPEGLSKIFNKKVINWGNSKRNLGPNMLNKNISDAINKLKSFQILKEKGIPVPSFTTSFDEAINWIENGNIVLARSLLESHSGKGIKVCHTIDELPDNAKLYVKYFPKKYEFRIHVFNGKVIDYTQKRKRNGLNPETNYNKYIRVHGNGWVFCRDNCLVKEHLKTLAVESVKALGLDFGAVDLVMLDNGKAKVLEVNTSPALQGQTLTSYVNAIKEYINVQER